MRQLQAMVMLFVGVAGAGVVRADAKSERAAVDKLAATWAPIGKLSGAPQITAACGSAPKLLEQGKAVAGKDLPTGAAVDLDSYANARNTVVTQLDSLDEACKSPDHTYKELNDSVPVSELMKQLDPKMTTLIDLGKARTLPDGVQKLRATFVATTFPSKKFCGQISTMTKQAAALDAVPPGADAAKWKAGAAAVKHQLSLLACTKKAADEEIGSGFNELRTNLTALILVIPPQ